MEATGTPSTAPAQGAQPGQDGQKQVPGAQTPPVPGAQTGDVKSAAAEAARKLKVKYDDGKEEDVDEAEIIRTYRERKKHQSVASKELNEGKMLRKQAEQFVEMLKDPEKLWEVARKLGHDPRKLSEAQLSRVLEDELMDPRDKELRDHKAKLSEFERREQERIETAQKQRMEELSQKYMKQYESEFVEAMKGVDLPPTKQTVAEMAKYIHRSAKIGFKLSASEAAQLVREDIQESQKRLFKDADGETLIKLLGPELANKVRAYDTSRLKNPASVLGTPPPSEQSRREPKDPGKRPSSREWQLKKRGLA